MIRRVVRVENELGLHARAAAKLVRLTSRFQASIKLSRRNGGEQVDAKSILGVLLLAASRGTELEVTASGLDEEAAVEAVEKLIQDRFGEER